MTVFTPFLTVLLSYPVWGSQFEKDPNGYIAFCPCMGRFGNQADHYLGAIGFAKGLNRTLILPPWVEYVIGEPIPVQVPFKKYFDVDKLREFHRVIPMEDFMTELAPEIWPQENRVAFCYSFRPGKSDQSCNAKDGSPFGPFWNTFDIHFSRSQTYGPLHYDIHNTDVATEWNSVYSAEKYPVLSFTGAPASFPVQKENIAIQKYLVWNEDMKQLGQDFINIHLNNEPYIGVHFRNGIDWKRACQYVHDSTSLFSAAQCVGYRNENGKLTEEMCQPSEEVIVKHLRKIVKEVKLKAIFIASDHDHMIPTLSKYFKDLKFVKQDNGEPHLDLVILGQATHFVGNCVSSFSAFVKRERDVYGSPSTFWGYPNEKITKHIEL